MRKLYPNTLTRDLARQLGRSERAVYMRADLLNLRKSAAFLASPEAGRLRGVNPASIKHRFKRGMTPWNLGRTGYMGANRTSFRKGRKPQTWRPVGAERTDVDGIAWVKLTDTGSKKDWRPVKDLVWETNNGAIPPGLIVTFKPGRKSSDAASITPDALELVSRAELMRRNTYHRYPKEIALAIQLRGALNRQINKRTSHAKQD